MRFRSIATVVLLSISCIGAQAADNAPIIDLNDLPPDNSAVSSVAAAPVASTSFVADDNAATARQSLPMDRRVQLLEQRLTNLAESNLPAKMDALEQQVNQLNGQLEEQTHAVQQLQDQLQQQIAENNSKPAVESPKTTSTEKVEKAAEKPAKSVVAANTASRKKSTEEKAEKAETATDSVAIAETAVVQNKATASASANSAAANSAKATSPEKSYQAAFDLMVKKQTTAATAAFKTFLKNYPDSAAYTPNAHYWLGELYSSSADKRSLASKEFSTLIQKYPTHAKVPDAMLKLAIMQDDAGQHAEAKQALQKITTQFPDSTAAKLAKMRLKAAAAH